MNGEFWGHHEFTNGSTGSWRTWMAKYEMDAAPFDLPSVTLTAGASATLTATGATPGRIVYFVYSLAGTGLTEEPGLSVTFSLASPIAVAGTATANASGVATLTRNVPGGTSGTDVWVQAAEIGRASNKFKTTIN